MAKCTLELFGVLALIASIFSMSSPARASTCDATGNFDVNILPGEYPNLVPDDPHALIPVVVFGSPGLDVREIDPGSLRLRTHALWESSRVERIERHAPSCEVRDLGRPDERYFDGIGPRDGHPDLVCDFTNDLVMFRRAAQPLTLTGHLFDDDDHPIHGVDLTAEPGELEDIVRCCIDCDEDGSCFGCSSGLHNCPVGNDIVQCSGSLPCYDCTGCKPPELC